MESVGLLGISLMLCFACAGGDLISDASAKKSEPSSKRQLKTPSKPIVLDLITKGNLSAIKNLLAKRIQGMKDYNLNADFRPFENYNKIIIENFEEYYKFITENESALMNSFNIEIADSLLQKTLDMLQTILANHTRTTTKCGMIAKERDSKDALHATCQEALADIEVLQDRIQDFNIRLQSSIIRSRFSQNSQDVSTTDDEPSPPIESTEAAA